MPRTLEVTYIRSGTGRPPRQRRTLQALGLKKLNDTVRHEDNSTIRGMVEKVHHLVLCREIEEGATQ